MWEQSLMQMTQKVNNNHKLAYKDRASLPPASWVSYSLHNRLCCCDHLRAATLVLQVGKILICSGCFNVFLNKKCFKPAVGLGPGCCAELHIKVNLYADLIGNYIADLYSQTAIIFVWGSIHQCADRFDDVSRGRQCTFMSISVFLCERSSCPVSKWTTSTVDQVLTDRDALYLKAFE